MENITDDTQRPWVLAELRQRLFGLKCNVVKEMLLVPTVTRVPNVPDYVRGVFNLRGRIIPLVDLRKRLAMPSAQEEVEEFCALMEQRANDHQLWLEKLTASVMSNSKIDIVTDPHKCAFGKWYDNFKSDNVVVSGFLRKFDAPHKAIHALASQVKQAAESDIEEAKRAIESARSGLLATLLQLFQDFQTVVRDTHREIAVVLNSADYAICVDTVVAVERLAKEGLEPLAQKGVDQADTVVTAVARRTKGEDVVMLLDTNAVLAPLANSYLGEDHLTQ